MLAYLHYGFAVIAGACVIAFVGFGAAAYQFLDPDRSLDDRLTTRFTPNRRASDFTGNGWRYQKLQWLSVGLFVISFLLFGLTGTP
jgi:hypothetical protein